MTAAGASGAASASCSIALDVAGVAYVITSYTNPHQVVRLARVLRNGSADAFVAVHHDDRQCTVDHAALDGLRVRRIEPPSRVAWGEPSQLEMVLRCLTWTLERDDFSWLVLLSGQDYPIRAVPDIERSLIEARADAFIEARPVDPPRLTPRGPVDEFAARYHYRWRRVSSSALRPRLARFAIATSPLLTMRGLPSGTWVGVPALRSPFGPQLKCHRGSDWFTLSRRAVEVVAAAVRARPEILRHYRRTIIP